MGTFSVPSMHTLICQIATPTRSNEKAKSGLQSVNWHDRNDAAIHIRRVAEYSADDEALASMKASLTPALISALKIETNDQTKKNLLRCIGRLGDESCLAVVRTFLVSEVREAAREAIDAISKTDNGSLDSSTDGMDLSPVMSVKDALKQSRQATKQRRLPAPSPGKGPLQTTSESEDDMDAIEFAVRQIEEQRAREAAPEPEAQTLEIPPTPDLFGDELFFDSMVLDTLDRSVEEHQKSANSAFVSALDLKQRTTPTKTPPNKIIESPITSPTKPKVAPTTPTRLPGFASPAKRKERPGVSVPGRGPAAPIFLGPDDDIVESPAKRPKLSEPPPAETKDAHPLPQLPLLLENTSPAKQAKASGSITDYFKKSSTTQPEARTDSPAETQPNQATTPGTTLTFLQNSVLTAVVELRLTEEQTIAFFRGTLSNLPAGLRKKLSTHPLCKSLKKDPMAARRIIESLALLKSQGLVEVDSFGLFRKLKSPNAVLPPITPKQMQPQLGIAPKEEVVPIQTPTGTATTQSPRPPSTASVVHFVDPRLQSGTTALGSFSAATDSAAASTRRSVSEPSVGALMNSINSFVFKPVGAKANASSLPVPPPFKTPKTEKAAINKTPDFEGLVLSDEQKHIITQALNGKSIFFTGAAGTGKSHLLREMVRILKEDRGENAVFVTAPTGIAACNINGCTIHSFAGIGLGKDPIDKLVTKVLHSPAKKRWRAAKVIVVDEVSMLSGELFDKLDVIARALRNNKAPFGGVQVILCGDFFQLPPVREGSNETNFCFESAAWPKVVDSTFILQHVYRQKEIEFIDLLNEVRTGNVTEVNYQKLLTCVNRTWTDSIAPTHLYPLKANVESFNKQCLDQLGGDSYEFRATDSSIEKHFMDSLASNCPAPLTLTLKKDAQVVLLKNIDVENDLVNGSRGKVVEFLQIPDDNGTHRMIPVVEFEGGRRRVIKPDKWSLNLGPKEVASREQIPLNLAWALSIHKAQGMTISRLEISLNKIFEDGQAYVALSRVTSLDGLRIQGLFNRNVIRANKKVIEFYQTQK